MSQHIYETHNKNGRSVTVTMGYDRPLDFVFCTVMTEDDEIIYSNLEDDFAGTDQQDVEYYRSVLLGLELEVPESMFLQVEADQVACVGNHVVVHTAAR